MFSSTVAGGRQARRDGWQWRVAFGLLVLLGTLPSESFSPQQFVTTHRFLDDSWRMALPAALDHNQISGRDLTFN